MHKGFMEKTEKKVIIIFWFCKEKKRNVLMLWIPTDLC